MEENKKCCEKGESMNHKDCCGSSGCCSWHKCYWVKYLIWLIIIIVVFCLGAQYGEMKASVRSSRFEGKMMNWNPERFENKINQNNLGATDSVTVETQLPPQE